MSNVAVDIGNLDDRRVPAAVLDYAHERRIDWFAGSNDCTIEHPNMNAAYDQLMRAIRHPAGFSQIHLIGPTGVGKDLLLRRAYQTLIEEQRDEMLADPDYMPVCMMEVPSPFNWSDFFVRGLRKLGARCVAHTLSWNEVDAAIQAGHSELARTLLRRLGVDDDELRRAFEAEVERRRTRVFILNEGHHVLHVRGRDRTGDQPEHVKSLASLSGLLLVMAGTYRLTSLELGSDQLGRRVLPIEFERYLRDVSADKSAYKSVLMTLQGLLPIEKQPNLLSTYDFMFTYSAGCVGILKDWLVRALTAALGDTKNAARTVTFAHLEETALSLKQLRTILRMAQDGEASLRATKDDEEEVARLVATRGDPRGALNIAANESDPAPGGASANARKGGSVGNRSPLRDPTGAGRRG